jgi:hypothetical protein
MKKAFTYTFIFISFIAIISCKKQNVEQTYTISGQLLESSSNAIPSSNFTLNLSQKADYSGLFSNVEGVRKSVNTDNVGNFSFTYQPEEYAGIGRGNYNQYSMTISGLIATNFYFDWTNIKPNMNVNLGKIYQYKKIDQLIRKIQFNAALNANDSIKINTAFQNQANSKNIYGPIASGTLLIVDTIGPAKLNWLNIATNTYSLGSTTIHSNFLREFIFQFALGDENQKDIVLLYP